MSTSPPKPNGAASTYDIHRTSTHRAKATSSRNCSCNIHPINQSQARVLSTSVSRKSSTQPTSRLTTRTIRGPRRPSKHQNLQTPGALESMPGYHVYPIKSHDAARKRNSRFGKKLDLVTKMTRDKGACILCRHHNKKVYRLSTNAILSFLTDDSSAIGLHPTAHVGVASKRQTPAVPQ